MKTALAFWRERAGECRDGEGEREGKREGDVAAGASLVASAGTAEVGVASCLVAVESLAEIGFESELEEHDEVKSFGDVWFTLSDLDTIIGRIGSNTAENALVESRVAPVAQNQMKLFDVPVARDLVGVQDAPVAQNQVKLLDAPVAQKHVVFLEAPVAQKHVKFLDPPVTCNLVEVQDEPSAQNQGKLLDAPVAHTQVIDAPVAGSSVMARDAPVAHSSVQVIVEAPVARNSVEVPYSEDEWEVACSEKLETTWCYGDYERTDDDVIDDIIEELADNSIQMVFGKSCFRNMQDEVYESCREIAYEAIGNLDREDIWAREGAFERCMLQALREKHDQIVALLCPKSADVGTQTKMRGGTRVNRD